MNGEFKSGKFGLVMVLFLFIALLVLSAAASAQVPTTGAQKWTPTPTPLPPKSDLQDNPQQQPVPVPSCSDGIQDGQEGGVDCGGACLLLDVPDVCDGVDNDRDCAVDEDNVCAKRTENKPQSETEQFSLQGQCSNGVQDGDEEGVDCGWPCILSTVVEDGCDGVDNNKDCEVDAVRGVGIMCQQAVEENRSEDAITIFPAKSIPVREAVFASSQLDKLSDAEVASYIEQNDGIGGIAQLRKLAKDKGVYIPESESDVQFGIKYMRFFWKHSKELEAKLSGREPTEKDWVDFLKQFSEGAYQKPQAKSESRPFFSKLGNFFKRLFS